MSAKWLGLALKTIPPYNHGDILHDFIGNVAAHYRIVHFFVRGRGRGENRNKFCSDPRTTFPYNRKISDEFSDKLVLDFGPALKSVLESELRFLQRKGGCFSNTSLNYPNFALPKNSRFHQIYNFGFRIPKRPPTSFCGLLEFGIGT